jgi:hypothetical protein
MKILKVAEFGGGIGATKKGEKLVEFVNKNNIKQEILLKLHFYPLACTLYFTTLKSNI